MEPIPRMSDPREVQAWHDYIEETTEAREQYSQAIGQAIAARDATLEAIDLATRKQRHEVWESHNAVISDAWREYMSATQSARLRRDSATFTTSELEVTP